MGAVWIIGRKATLPNGHEYITEPFIAFETNEDAQAACDMVEKVSGERPGIASGALYKKGETARPSRAGAGRKGGDARAAALTPERRSEIASDAAKTRWGRDA